MVTACARSAWSELLNTEQFDYGIARIGTFYIRR